MERGNNVGLYEELELKKIHGEKLDFDTISKEDLKILFFDEGKSDNIIADLFDVTYSKVRYKRKKYDINFKYLVFEEALDNLPKAVNSECKRNLLTIGNIDKISKAITHFAFRNGPIEGMHANNQLSDMDMKKLNKFMVNRIAYIFQLIIEEKWFELEYLINITDRFYGHNWEKSIPDDGGIHKVLMMKLKDFKK